MILRTATATAATVCQSSTMDPFLILDNQDDKSAQRSWMSLSLEVILGQGVLQPQGEHVDLTLHLDFYTIIYFTISFSGK